MWRIEGKVGSIHLFIKQTYVGLKSTFSFRHDLISVILNLYENVSSSVTIFSEMSPRLVNAQTNGIKRERGRF